MYMLDVDMYMRVCGCVYKHLHILCILTYAYHLYIKVYICVCCVRVTVSIFVCLRTLSRVYIPEIHMNICIYIYGQAKIRMNTIPKTSCYLCKEPRKHCLYFQRVLAI